MDPIEVFKAETIKEYKDDLKRLRKELNKVRSEAEYKTIREMISSTEYALFWIENGRERKFGDKYSVTRMSKDRRTEFWGNIEWAKAVAPENPRELTKEEQELSNIIINLLSDREKEVFMSVCGKGNTQEQAAEYLGIQTGTLKKYLDRARNKVLKEIQYGLVLN